MSGEGLAAAPPARREAWIERVVAAVLRKTLEATLLPTFRADRPIPEQRRRLLRVTRLTLRPRGVRFEPGLCGGVRGEFVRRRDAAERAGSAVLYLHGGAYCVGSPMTHRTIAGTLAHLTGATVVVVDYRLAPEHPCPAAIDDTVAAYLGLVASGREPRHIAIAGDSAGGGLALAAALRLRERGHPLPAALVTFSPWVDLDDPDRGPVPPGEVMISPSWVRACARHYLGTRAARDPMASPIYGDLAGLAPTLIQVGSDEWLLPDARRLHEALRRAGVPSTLEEYPRRWHVFQAHAGVLADADRALASVARFLRETWDRPAGDGSDP
ncbi:MAG TPA: alpha/beta hydrolase [Steroidobacteraceae bacterium]|nr:alpha/beta hydrolase [Steroidobacteraceae bacterium]